MALNIFEARPGGAFVPAFASSGAGAAAGPPSHHGAHPAHGGGGGGGGGYGSGTLRGDEMIRSGPRRPEATQRYNAMVGLCRLPLSNPR